MRGLQVFGLGPMSSHQKFIMTFGTALLAFGAVIQLVMHLVSGGQDGLYYLFGVAVTVAMFVIVRRTPIKGEKK